MKRKRFTEERIFAVLRNHEAGAKAADLPASASLEDDAPQREAQHGGIDASDAKHPKAPEHGNESRLHSAMRLWA